MLAKIEPALQGEQPDWVLVQGDTKTALAQAVDGVLLMMDVDKTWREAARRAVESLRQVGANVVGVVLNAGPTHRGSYYYSYHEHFGDGSGGRKHRLSWRGRIAALRFA